MEKILLACTARLCRTLLIIALWREGEHRNAALSEELDRLGAWAEKFGVYL